MKYPTGINLSMAAMVFLPAFFPGCSSEKTPQRQDVKVKVHIETVTQTDLTRTFSYVGVVTEKSAVALSFPALGTIESIYVSEGQHVVRGQLLARLDLTSAKSLRDAAGSSLKQAKDAYDRLKSIYDNGSLPEIRMVEMETKLQQAQSAFNIAEKNLENCSLYSPVSGIIGRKMAESGENTMIGKTVLTILDITSVRIRFSVPESEIPLIPSDCNSIITVAAAGDKVFCGKGIQKSVTANAVSHTYPAHIELSNPQKQLLPGMVCRVEIHTGNNSYGITVPVGTVLHSADGKKFVWSDERGFARRKFIVTGNVRGNDLEVISGLSAGDRIVTGGHQKLSEGVKISE
jgi:RND family efflux transporter MFP subunit